MLRFHNRSSLSLQGRLRRLHGLNNVSGTGFACATGDGVTSRATRIIAV